MDIFNETRAYVVLKWVSENEKYQKLDKVGEKMCDMVKKFVNARNCSLVIKKDVENVCQGVGIIPHNSEKGR